MKRRALILIAVIATVSAACAGPNEASDPHQTDTPSDGSAATSPAGLEGTWILLDGVPVVDGFPITLSVDPSGIVGTAACNSYFGEADVLADRITIGQLGATDMACEPAVMASESAYMQALIAVATWSVTDGQLILTGPNTTLVFEPDSPPPMEALIGTTWILDTLTDGDIAKTPVGDAALLTLHDDGTFDGSTGCRILAGRWVENGAQIDFPEMSAEGECPADIREQDGFVVTVLGDGFRATIDGPLLSVMSVGNQSLVYRASQPGESTDLPVPQQPVELVSACGYVTLGNAQNPMLPDAPLSETAKAAFDPYLAMTEGEYGFFAGYEWFLADEADGEFTLFGIPLEPTAEGYADVRFELRDGKWDPIGWGTCHPTVSTGHDRSAWGLATWILDPDSPPDPDSTSIPVLINERNCAGGKPPVDREIFAQAIQEDGALIITVLVEPVEGGADCQGNPWYATVIDVNETPDGRALFDGSATPAEERTWPPSHPDYFANE